MQHLVPSHSKVSDISDSRSSAAQRLNERRGHTLLRITQALWGVRDVALKKEVLSDPHVKLEGITVLRLLYCKKRLN
jgi:hypothetical protein